MSTTNSLSKILLAFMLLAVVTFTACDDEAEVVIDDPSASLSGTDFSQTEFEPGEIIDLTLTFSAPQGLSGVNYQFFNADDDTQIGSKVFLNPDVDITGVTSDDVSGSINFTFTTPDVDDGTNVDLVMEVVDQTSANSAQATFSFTVIDPSIPVDAFQAILLQAPTAAETSESFFSTSTGERYTVQEVNTGSAGTSANIDFGYYYGANNNATLAAPDAYPSNIYDLNAEGWNQLNGTMFRSTSLTDAEFNEIDDLAEVLEAWDNGTDGAMQKTQLAVGDVLAFQTDASKTGGTKTGLLLVSALSPGPESDKSITLEILVEQQ